MFYFVLFCRVNSYYFFLEIFLEFVMLLKFIIDNELEDFLSKKYLNVLIVIFEIFGFGKSEEI